jgi:hypothetical protein
MSNNWQFDNRGSWKTKKRFFWYAFNRGKSYHSDNHRRYRRGKLVGFLWGFLWCMQILVTVAAVRIIFDDREVVVTRASAHIAQ